MDEPATRRPRTEAGKDLLSRTIHDEGAFATAGWLNQLGAAIVAIEREAALASDEWLERLGFDDLLTIGEQLLAHYPPETIVCSHRETADIGARTSAAIADLIASCRDVTSRGDRG